VIDRCESCGREEEVVSAVHRVYLTLADWDREERVEILPDLELWCWVCREHYPHQLADDPDPDPDPDSGSGSAGPAATDEA